jgi:hypothetical protein
VDVFGFDMKGRKVLGAVSHIMPIITVDPVSADDLRAVVEKCVLACELVAETLEKIARNALVGPKASDAEKRIANFEADKVKTAFLTVMERHVEGAIRTAAAAIRSDAFDPLAHARILHTDMRREAEVAFDARLPTDMWVHGLERRVIKRWELAGFLNGMNKAGAELFARLQLPTPEAKEEAKNAA